MWRTVFLLIRQYPRHTSPPPPLALVRCVSPVVFVCFVCWGCWLCCLCWGCCFCCRVGVSVSAVVPRSAGLPVAFLLSCGSRFLLFCGLACCCLCLSLLFGRGLLGRSCGRWCVCCLCFCGLCLSLLCSPVRLLCGVAFVRCVVVFRRRVVPLLLRRWAGLLFVSRVFLSSFVWAVPFFGLLGFSSLVVFVRRGLCLWLVRVGRCCLLWLRRRRRLFLGRSLLPPLVVGACGGELCFFLLRVKCPNVKISISKNFAKRYLIARPKKTKAREGAVCYSPRTL